MSCRPTPVDLCGHVSRRRRSKSEDSDFQIPGTKETGRLHFFYHCPCSQLPVRDVLGIQGHGRKTEPYIEKCAENYCQECVQKNIVGFLKSKEKCLFLFTTCRNTSFYNKRFIVGYIRKDRARLRRGYGRKWWSVQGIIKIVAFDEAYLLDRLVGGLHYKTLRRERLNQGQTARVFAKLGKGRNIVDKCKAEIKRLLARADNDS